MNKTTQEYNELKIEFNVLKETCDQLQFENTQLSTLLGHLKADSERQEKQRRNSNASVTPVKMVDIELQKSREKLREYEKCVEELKSDLYVALQHIISKEEELEEERKANALLALEKEKLEQTVSDMQQQLDVLQHDLNTTTLELARNNEVIEEEALLTGRSLALAAQQSTSLKRYTEELIDKYQLNTFSVASNGTSEIERRKRRRT